MPGPAIQLLLLAVVLYLQDALLLLTPTEAVLCPDRKGRWQLGLSQDSLRIGNRELYIPNLLLIHQPLFRGGWLPVDLPSPSTAAATATQAPGAGWQARAAVLAPLAPWVTCCALLLFAALPLAFWSGAPPALLLGLLGGLYAAILGALSWVWRQRKVLDLTPRQVAGLASECLLCPPVSLNLLRRLALASRPERDVVAAAERLLDGVAWGQARQDLAGRVRGVLDASDPASGQHQAALGLLARLTATGAAAAATTAAAEADAPLSPDAPP